MRKDNLFSTLLLVVVVALFLFGVFALLRMRFQAGNIYPPYSSYRSDPLGTKALYDGLSLLHGVETKRNVEPLKKVSGLTTATIFVLGISPGDFTHMETATAQALGDAAQGGGRVVIAFVPTLAKPVAPDKGEKQNAQKKEGQDRADEEQELTPLHRGFVDLGKQWSVEIGLSAEHVTEATLCAAAQNLPPTLAWNCTRIFHPQDTAWRTIYAVGDDAVVMERVYGKGTICLAADSFLLSNEAMKDRRYPLLLSWLCGSNHRIIFDETHLGISKAPGVATLLRQYGLGPFFISLIMLALLAIWRASASLIPAPEEKKEAILKPGKDYSTGLTNLLRRNIPFGGILAVCLEEWKRSFTHGKRNLSSVLPAIQEIVIAEQTKPKKTRDPVHAYQRISGILSLPRTTRTMQIQTSSPPRERVAKQRSSASSPKKHTVRKKNSREELS
jgi:hypothetical protein